ncbi:double zinc ribbon domain-containing protein [Pseudomonas sp. LRF_L74]|uniref:double zinc ribbon domain-containing protein n=1 Tax=Pseudomonas sp. LRF_L74 TaxID=3369422 RepID=UPI003F5EF762
MLTLLGRLRGHPNCLLCGARGENAARLPLCPGCERDLPWLGNQCQTCALPLPVAGMTCGECLKRSPGFARVEAPWRYAFPVDSLINRFKHQGKWPLGRLLGDLLIGHLEQAFSAGQPRPDLLLAVPLSSRRRRQRGFNQAEMLADWLANGLQLRHEKRWLLRPRDTAHQQQLDAVARQRNLRQAFALHPAATPTGLHIALVDDVLTTGATARTISRLLMRAGARRVDVYCLARTGKPGDD